MRCIPLAKRSRFTKAHTRTLLECWVPGFCCYRQTRRRWSAYHQRPTLGSRVCQRPRQLRCVGYPPFRCSAAQGQPRLQLQRLQRRLHCWLTWWLPSHSMACPSSWRYRRPRQSRFTTHSDAATRLPMQYALIRGKSTQPTTPPSTWLLAAADVVPLGQRGHKYCDDMSKTCCSLPKWWRLTEVAPWASYRWSISVLILIAALVPHVLCVAPAVRHCGCYVCKCFPHDTNYFCQSHHLSFRRLLSCALRLAVQLANAARRAVVPLAIVKYLLRCNLDAVTAACLGVQRR